MDAFRGIPPNVDLSSKEEEEGVKGKNGFEGASTGQADSGGQMGVFANLTTALASQLLHQQQQEQSNGNNNQQQIPPPIPPSSFPLAPQLLPSPVIIPVEPPQQPLPNGVIFSQLMLYNLLLRRNVGINNLLEVPMAAAQSLSEPLIFDNSPLIPVYSPQSEAVENGTNMKKMALVENGTNGEGERMDVLDNGTHIGGMALVGNGTNGGGMAFDTGISQWAANDAMKSEVSPLAIANSSSPPKRNPTICVVCAKMSLYNYYGVKCCESCKQFFRRIIIRQTEFFCARSGKCEIEGGVEKCRGCRMDKCLLVGMDPHLINVPISENREQFLAKIEERRTQLVVKKQMRGN